jgi:hypothetical protein
LGGSAQERGKGCRRLERSELASESELVFFKSSFEASQELSLEDETENFDRQKELRSAGNPSLMIWGESSSRDYAMQMGMSEKSLAPSMQNGQKADVGAQVFGIRSDLEESLGRGPKQQAINQSLILQGQWSQDVGRSEDDMIVGGRATVRRNASLTSAGELPPGIWGNADSNTSYTRWLAVRSYHTARRPATYRPLNATGPTRRWLSL